MGNAYLNIAERVLIQARQPMTPAEIIDRAYLEDLVPWHLHGSTQHKTMHARLSEDISRHRDGSAFFRTGPGHFFLRSLKSDPLIPENHKVEFHAPPRRKELRRDTILAIHSSTLFESGVDLARVPLDYIGDCLRQGRYAYSHWTDLHSSNDYTPIYSFVVVHRGCEILSFRCGKFTPRSDPLYGMRSVGFGGAVLETDVDFLYDSFFGIIGSGINELVYGAGLPRRLAEDARYHDHLRPHFGTVIESKNGPNKYLHVVLGYRCPDDFTPAKTALSLNDLRWVWANNPGNSINDYDATSQLLFDRGYIGEIASEN